jgi:FG-GAP repeat
MEKFICTVVRKVDICFVNSCSKSYRGIRVRNNFGISMGMSGDGRVLVIGSTGYKTESGATYVLERNSDGGQWLLSHRIASSAPQPHAFFGFKLAMDYSGEILAVGADGEDEYRGSVYIYERKLGQNEQSLTNCGIERFGAASHFRCPTRLQAPDRASEDNYGGSLAVSGDGSVLAVGSPGKKLNGESDHGAVYVYQRTNARNASKTSKWVQVGIDFLGAPHSQSGSYYAWALSLTNGGNRLVVTAPEAYEGCGVVAVEKVPTLPDSSKVRFVVSLTARLINYFAGGKASFLEAHDDL